MNQITIDCLKIETPRQLHELLAQALSFPDRYGGNLDALHDCLTALPDETLLIFQDFTALPPVSRGFLRVLWDSAEENPNLHVQFT